MREREGQPAPPAGHRVEARAAALVAFTAVAAVAPLLVWRMRQSVWLDEAYGAWLAGLAPARVIEELGHDIWPPLHFLLLNGWTHIFGSSEWALRSLPLVCFALASFVIYRTAAQAAGLRLAGIVGAALYASNPLVLGGAVSARGYSLLCLLASLLIWLYVRDRSTEVSKPAVLLLALVATAGCLTHYFFIPFLVGLSAAAWTFGPRGDRTRLAATLALTSISFGALWGPVLWTQIAGAHRSTAVEAPWPGELARTLVGLSWAGAVPVALAAAILTKRRGRRGRLNGLLHCVRQPLALTLAATTVATVAVPLVLALWWPLYVSRYARASVVPLTVLLALGTARLEPKRMALFSACVILVSTLTLARAWQHESRPWDDRRAAQFLAMNTKTGDAVVFVELNELPIAYYLDRADATRSLRRISFPAEARDHPGWLSARSTPEGRKALDREAASVAHELATGQHSRVYVVGSSAILSERLAQKLRLLETHQTPALFFQQISVYEHADEGSSGRP